MKRLTDDRTLSPADFLLSLEQLNWKQSDFARKTGLTVQTVSRWATGQAAAPLWASEYLGLLLELKRLHTAYLVPPKLDA